MIVLGALLLISLWLAVAIFAFHGQDAAATWVSACVLESALSLDDLFTMHLVFVSFATPDDIANTCLAIAMVIAIICRCLMIVCFETFLGMSEVANILVGTSLISGAVLAFLSEAGADVRDTIAVRAFKALLGKFLKEDHEGYALSYSTKGGLQINVQLLVLCMLAAVV